MHSSLAQTGGKSLIRFRVSDSFLLPLILQFFYLYIIWKFSSSPFSYFFFLIQMIWESSFIVLQSAILETLVIVH